MAFAKRAGIALVALVLTGCQALGLVKQYEYDERVELSLDGSAVVDISASIPALVALRGATLSVDPEARFDRQAFRRLYEGPGVSVREVSAFRRHGRRFVHVRLDVDDITALPRLVPLSWSRYRLDRLATFPYYSQVDDLGDLPPIVTQQIEHFFSHYKDLEPGKWAKLNGWGDREVAMRLIDRRRSRGPSRARRGSEGDEGRLPG